MAHKFNVGATPFNQYDYIDQLAQANPLYNKDLYAQLTNDQKETYKWSLFANPNNENLNMSIYDSLNLPESKVDYLGSAAGGYNLEKSLDEVVKDIQARDKYLINKQIYDNLTTGEKFLASLGDVLITPAETIVGAVEAIADFGAWITSGIMNAAGEDTTDLDNWIAKNWIDPEAKYSDSGSLFFASGANALYNDGTTFASFTKNLVQGVTDQAIMFGLGMIAPPLTYVYLGSTVAGRSAQDATIQRLTGAGTRGDRWGELGYIATNTLVSAGLYHAIGNAFGGAVGGGVRNKLTAFANKISNKVLRGASRALISGVAEGIEEVCEDIWQEGMQSAWFKEHQFELSAAELAQTFGIAALIGAFGSITQSIRIEGTNFTIMDIDGSRKTKRFEMSKLINEATILDTKLRSGQDLTIEEQRRYNRLKETTIAFDRYYDNKGRMTDRQTKNVKHAKTTLFDLIGSEYETITAYSRSGETEQELGKKYGKYDKKGRLKLLPSKLSKAVRSGNASDVVSTLTAISTLHELGAFIAVSDQQTVTNATVLLNEIMSQNTATRINNAVERIRTYFKFSNKAEAQPRLTTTEARTHNGENSFVDFVVYAGPKTETPSSTSEQSFGSHIEYEVSNAQPTDEILNAANGHDVKLGAFDTGVPVHIDTNGTVYINMNQVGILSGEQLLKEISAKVIAYDMNKSIGRDGSFFVSDQDKAILDNLLPEDFAKKVKNIEIVYEVLFNNPELLNKIIARNPGAADELFEKINDLAIKNTNPDAKSRGKKIKGTGKTTDAEKQVTAALIQNYDNAVIESVHTQEQANEVIENSSTNNIRENTETKIIDENDIIVSKQKVFRDQSIEAIKNKNYGSVAESMQAFSYRGGATETQIRVNRVVSFLYECGFEFKGYNGPGHPIAQILDINNWSGPVQELLATIINKFNANDMRPMNYTYGKKYSNVKSAYAIKEPADSINLWLSHDFGFVIQKATGDIILTDNIDRLVNRDIINEFRMAARNGQGPMQITLDDVATPYLRTIYDRAILRSIKLTFVDKSIYSPYGGVYSSPNIIVDVSKNRTEYTPVHEIGHALTSISGLDTYTGLELFYKSAVYQALLNGTKLPKNEFVSEMTEFMRIYDPDFRDTKYLESIYNQLQNKSVETVKKLVSITAFVDSIMDQAYNASPLEGAANGFRLAYTQRHIIERVYDGDVIRYKSNGPGLLKWLNNVRISRPKVTSVADAVKAHVGDTYQNTKGAILVKYLAPSKRIQGIVFSILRKHDLLNKTTLNQNDINSVASEIRQSVQKYGGQDKFIFSNVDEVYTLIQACQQLYMDKNTTYGQDVASKFSQLRTLQQTFKDVTGSNNILDPMAWEQVARATGDPDAFKQAWGISDNLTESVIADILFERLGLVYSKAIDEWFHFDTTYGEHWLDSAIAGLSVKSDFTAIGEGSYTLGVDGQLYDVSYNAMHNMQDFNMKNFSVTSPAARQYIFDKAIACPVSLDIQSNKVIFKMSSKDYEQRSLNVIQALRTIRDSTKKPVYLQLDDGNLIQAFNDVRIDTQNSLNTVYNKNSTYISDDTTNAVVLNNIVYTTDTDSKHRVTSINKLSELLNVDSTLEYNFSDDLPVNLSPEGVSTELSEKFNEAGVCSIYNGKLYISNNADIIDIRKAIALAREQGINDITVDGQDIDIDEYTPVSKRKFENQIQLPWNNPQLKSYSIIQQIAKLNDITNIHSFSNLGFSNEFISMAKSEYGVSYRYLLDMINRRTDDSLKAVNSVIAVMYPNNSALHSIEDCDAFLYNLAQYLPVMPDDRTYLSFEDIKNEFDLTKPKVVTPNTFYEERFPQTKGTSDYAINKARYQYAMLEALGINEGKDSSEVNNIMRMYSTLLNGNYVYSHDSFEKFVREAKVGSGFVSGLLKTVSTDIETQNKDQDSSVDITDKQVAKNYAAGIGDFAKQLADKLHLPQKFIDKLREQTTPLEMVEYVERVLDRIETRLDSETDIDKRDQLQDSFDAYYKAYTVLQAYVNKLPEEQRDAAIKVKTEYDNELDKIDKMSFDEKRAYLKQFTNVDRFKNRERFTEEQRKNIINKLSEGGTRAVSNAQSKLSKNKTKLPENLHALEIRGQAENDIMSFVNKAIKKANATSNFNVQANNLDVINDFIKQLPQLANKLKASKGVYFDEQIFNQLLDKYLITEEEPVSRQRFFEDDLNDILGIKNTEQPEIESVAKPEIESVAKPEIEQPTGTFETPEKTKNIKYTAASELLSDETRKTIGYNTDIEYTTNVKHGNNYEKSRLNSQMFVADNANTINRLLNNTAEQRDFIEWYKNQSYGLDTREHLNAMLLLTQIATFSSDEALVNAANDLLTKERSAAGQILGTKLIENATPVTQLSRMAIAFDLTAEDKATLQNAAQKERDALANNDFTTAFEAGKEALEVFSKYDKGVKVNPFEKGLSKAEKIRRGKNLWKRIDAFRYLAMLSNPKTFLVKNEASNAISTATDKVSTAIGTAISGKLNKQATGRQYKRSKRSAKSDAVVAKHIVDNGLLDGLISSKINRSGTKYTIKTNKVRPGKLTSDLGFDQPELNTMDVINGPVEQGTNAELELTMSQENALFGRKTFGNSKIGEAFNKFQDAVYGTMDKFDRKHQTKYVTKLASEIIAESFTELELDQLLSDNPPEDLMNRLYDILDYSMNEGLKVYFKHEPKVYKIYQDLCTRYPAIRVLGSLILPFPRFAVNAAEMAFEYSPAGLAKGLYELIKFEQAEKKTNQERQTLHNSAEYQNATEEQRTTMDNDFNAAHAQDPFTSMKVGKDLGKGITGTALLALGAILGAAGILGFDEEKKYLGPQLYLGDFHIDISDLSPSLTALLCGGIWTAGGSEGGATAMMNSFFETLFLGDITGMFKQDTATSIKSLGSNYALSFIPSIIKALARVIDPRDKNTNSKFIRKFAAALPIVSYAVPAKVDPYTGDNKYTFAKNSGAGTLLSLINSFVSPASMYSTSGSDIEQEAKRVGATTSGPNSKFTVGEEEYQLKGRELEEYQRERARIVYELSQELIKTEEYQNATDEEKAKMLKRVYSQATDQAKTNYALNA